MIYNISHNDLDGIGCNLVVCKNIPNVQRINCGYDALTNNLHLVEDKIEQISELYITDLSLNLDTYKIINRIAKRSPKTKIVIIDHHKQEFDASELYNVPNITNIIDTSKSASLLTYEYFNNQPKELKAMINAINVFDLWLEDSPIFNQGMDMNDLFWAFKSTRFFNTFMNNVNKNHLKKELEAIQIDKKRYFDNNIKKGLINVSDECVISFIERYLPWVKIYYPNRLFYINATLQGRLHIRLHKSFTDEESIIIKERIINQIPADRVVAFGGHPKAFGMTHKGEYNQEEIITYVRIIAEVISGLREEIK